MSTSGPRKPPVSVSVCGTHRARERQRRQRQKDGGFISRGMPHRLPPGILQPKLKPDFLSTNCRALSGLMRADNNPSTECMPSTTTSEPHHEQSYTEAYDRLVFFTSEGNTVPPVHGLPTVPLHNSLSSAGGPLGHKRTTSLFCQDIMEDDPVVDPSMAGVDDTEAALLSSRIPCRPFSLTASAFYQTLNSFTGAEQNFNDTLGRAERAALAIDSDDPDYQGKPLSPDLEWCSAPINAGARMAGPSSTQHSTGNQFMASLLSNTGEGMQALLATLRGSSGRQSAKPSTRLDNAGQTVVVPQSCQPYATVPRSSARTEAALSRLYCRTGNAQSQAPAPPPLLGEQPLTVAEVRRRYGSHQTGFRDRLSCLSAVSMCNHSGLSENDSLGNTGTREGDQFSLGSYASFLHTPASIRKSLQCATANSCSKPYTIPPSDVGLDSSAPSNMSNRNHKKNVPTGVLKKFPASVRRSHPSGGEGSPTASVRSNRRVVYRQKQWKRGRTQQFDQQRQWCDRTRLVCLDKDNWVYEDDPCVGHEAAMRRVLAEEEEVHKRTLLSRRRLERTNWRSREGRLWSDAHKKPLKSDIHISVRDGNMHRENGRLSLHHRVCASLDPWGEDASASALANAPSNGSAAERTVPSDTPFLTGNHQGVAYHRGNPDGCACLPRLTAASLLRNPLSQRPLDMPTGVASGAAPVIGPSHLASPCASRIPPVTVAERELLAFVLLVLTCDGYSHDRVDAGIWTSEPVVVGHSSHSSGDSPTQVGQQLLGSPRSFVSHSGGQQESATMPLGPKGDVAHAYLEDSFRELHVGSLAAINARLARAVGDSVLPVRDATQCDGMGTPTDHSGEGADSALALPNCMGALPMIIQCGVPPCSRQCAQEDIGIADSEGLEWEVCIDALDLGRLLPRTLLDKAMENIWEVIRLILEPCSERTEPLSWLRTWSQVLHGALFNTYTMATDTFLRCRSPTHKRECHVLQFSVNATAAVEQSRWRSVAFKVLADRLAEQQVQDVVVKETIRRTSVAKWERPKTCPIEGVRGVLCMHSPTQSDTDLHEGGCSRRSSRVTARPEPDSPPRQGAPEYHPPFRNRDKVSDSMEVNGIPCAPRSRGRYPLDMLHLYIMTSLATEETENVLVPRLRRQRDSYQLSCNHLVSGGGVKNYSTAVPVPYLRRKSLLFASHLRRSSRVCESDIKSAAACPLLDNDLPRSSTMSAALEQLRGLRAILALEAGYAHDLSTLQRHVLTTHRYHEHVDSYNLYLQSEKAFWGPRYQSALRISYLLCNFLVDHGLEGTPEVYLPLLQPVAMFMGCAGGHREMMTKLPEMLLEVAERAKRVRMPIELLDLKNTGHAQLEAAAYAMEVCGGTLDVVSCLATEADVLSVPLSHVKSTMFAYHSIPPISEA